MRNLVIGLALLAILLPASAYAQDTNCYSDGLGGMNCDTAGQRTNWHSDGLGGITGHTSPGLMSGIGNVSANPWSQPAVSSPSRPASPSSAEIIMQVYQNAHARQAAAPQVYYVPVPSTPVPTYSTPAQIRSLHELGHVACPIGGETFAKGTLTCPTHGVALRPIKEVAAKFGIITDTDQPANSSSSQTKFCPVGGEVYAWNAVICPNHGVALQSVEQVARARRLLPPVKPTTTLGESKKFCPVGGEIYGAEVRFCPNHGVSLQEVASAAAASRVTPTATVEGEIIAVRNLQGLRTEVKVRNRFGSVITVVVTSHTKFLVGEREMASEAFKPEVGLRVNVACYFDSGTNTSYAATVKSIDSQPVPPVSSTQEAVSAQTPTLPWANVEMLGKGPFVWAAWLYGMLAKRAGKDAESPPAESATGKRAVTVVRKQ